MTIKTRVCAGADCRRGDSEAGASDFLRVRQEDGAGTVRQWSAAQRSDADQSVRRSAGDASAAGAEHSDAVSRHDFEYGRYACLLFRTGRATCQVTSCQRIALPRNSRELSMARARKKSLLAHFGDQKAPQHRTFSQIDDGPMELLVQVQIPLECIDVQLEHRVHFVADLA